MVLLQIQKNDTLNSGRIKINEAIKVSEKSDVKSDNAVNIATITQSKLVALQQQVDDLIINSGTSDAETIAARTNTETGETYQSLRNRLDDDFSKVQLLSVTNPEFLSSYEDDLVLSEEILTNEIEVTMGSGWSGNVNDGFTHISGNSDELIFELPDLIPGATYNVEFNITNPAEVDNGQSDYWFSLGNSPEFETYKGKNNHSIWGVKTVSGNTMIVKPYSNYNGTLNISIKQVMNEIKPYAVYQDNSKLITLEMRLSKANKNSIYVGKNAGRYTNEFAEQNTVLGNYAGENITSGFWNVLLGYNAGRYGTTATRNVAIGRHALMENITGNRIVAIGSWSVMRNKTGENLIGIGADSLYNNIDGSDNIGIGTVAIGQNPNGRYLIGLGDRVMSGSEGGEHTFAAGRLTLYYNKGSHNAAIGQQAGYQNREGSHNLFVGFRAGMLNQTGHNIVAIGNEALFNNLEHNNIGIGNRAQYHNKNGKYNLSFGYQSSYENIDGNYNISAGYQALHSNKQSENIAFGRDSAANLDGNNNIAIGSRGLRHFKGDQNIGIGSSAGQREGATGDGNVFIGHNSGANHLEGNYNIIIGRAVNKSLANTSNELNIGNAIKSKDMTLGIIELKRLQLTNLPTSKPSENGMVWNDNGTLKVA